MKEFFKELLKPVIFVLKIFIFLVTIVILGALFSNDEKEANLVRLNLTGVILDDAKMLEKIYEIRDNDDITIGSIGVIMDGLNLGELTDKIGIKPQVVKAGKFKEAGTFMREWSEEERESLQRLVDENYALFTSEVAAARKLDLRDVDAWANARVFTAQGAQKLHLIDDVTTYETAMKEVEELSGVSDPIWEKPNKYDEFIDEISSKTANMIFSFLQTKLR